MEPRERELRRAWRSLPTLDDRTVAGIEVREWVGCGWVENGSEEFDLGSGGVGETTDTR
jgi:hypothetical protein